MPVRRSLLALLSLAFAFLWNVTAPPANRAHAASSEASVHPWPQPFHDAQRTSRASVVGPQTATTKHVFGPPSNLFYFVDYADITVSRSGRAFAPVQHCIWYPEGCLGFYSLVAQLWPDGTTRWFPRGLQPQYYGAPVIGEDGSLYMDSSLGLTALTPRGAVKWRYSGAGSPTLGADGTIYAFTGSQLIALDSAGTLTWSAPLPDMPFTDLAIGPDGTFYYGTVQRYLTALSPDGTLKWRFFTSDQMHSSPAVADDGTVYAGGRSLYAVSPEGALIWSYTSSGMSFSGTTPALGADGAVYFPTTGGVIALNPDGTQRWVVPVYGANRRLIIDADGTVYTGWSASIYNSGFLAISNTGLVKWTFPVASPDVVNFAAALALGADGTLYGATPYKIFAIRDPD